jgi:hypothetical protein
MISVDEWPTIDSTVVEATNGNTNHPETTSYLVDTDRADASACGWCV